MKWNSQKLFIRRCFLVGLPLAALACSSEEGMTSSISNELRSCDEVPSYFEGTREQEVQNHGRVFRCDVPGWCQGAAWAREPGVGTYWEMSWTEIDSCSTGTGGSSSGGSSSGGSASGGSASGGSAGACDDTNQGGGACEADPWQSGKSYQEGDLVEFEGEFFACKEWPYTAWCSSRQVGVSLGWEDGWEKVESCAGTIEIIPSEQPAPTGRAAVDGQFIAPTQFVLKSGSVGGASWRYTTNAPQGVSWSQEGFYDGNWSVGEPGFSGADSRPGDVVGTPWSVSHVVDSDNPASLWLRKTFRATECDLQQLMLWARWDDRIEIYVNGVLAASEQGWSAGYRYVGLNSPGRAALRVGSNTLAVKVIDEGGGRYFDLGVVRNAQLLERPTTGFESTTELGVFSDTVKRFMIEHGIPAATLAVMKEDELVVSRSFGWMEKEMLNPVPQNAVFRLASNDKPISLYAVRRIIDTATVDTATGETITESTQVFPLLRAHGLTSMPGSTPDSRVDDITIGQLIRHESGLNEMPGAVQFYQDMQKSSGQTTRQDNVRWVYSSALRWAPGSRSKYTSSGYMVLRYLVQVLKGDLITYLREDVLSPNGGGDVFIAHERLAGRSAREPWYATLEAPYDRWVQLEDYTGLAASAEMQVRAMRRYSLKTGSPMNFPLSGVCDWNWGNSSNQCFQFGGGYAGTTSFQIQDGVNQVNIAVNFNLGGAYNSLAFELRRMAQSLPASAWGL